MIQRLAANRRKRQPRSKKEKMLDLLGRDRAGHPTRREELPPETVERVKAEIREETRRERRRKTDHRMDHGNPGTRGGDLSFDFVP